MQVAIEQRRIVVVHVEYVFVEDRRRRIGLNRMAVHARDAHVAMAAVFPVIDDARGYVAMTGYAVLAGLGKPSRNRDCLDAAQVTDVQRIGFLRDADRTNQRKKNAENTSLEFHCIPLFAMGR